MLIETQLAAGTDHMMQLGERRFLVWDRAEHKRDDTSIEGRGHARKAQDWVVRRRGRAEDAFGRSSRLRRCPPVD
jgi:hypothetical protein